MAAGLIQHPLAQSPFIYLAIPELPGTQQAISEQLRLQLPHRSRLELTGKARQAPKRQAVVEAKTKPPLPRWAALLAIDGQQQRQPVTVLWHLPQPAGAFSQAFSH